jgi:hypothetical protein
MHKRESIDVFEAIEDYYASQDMAEHMLRKSWVEEHLLALEDKGQSIYKLVQVWDDINAFSIYINHMGYPDISSIPHWQYSAFIHWTVNQLNEPDYSLELKHVRRLMGNLRVFIEFLVDKAHISNLREISTAYEYICGRDEVRLVELLPYTGAAHWLTASASFNGGKVIKESVFTKSDYWLLLLLLSVGGSWKHLKDLASTVPTRSGGTRKLSIYHLMRKLKRIGYEKNPSDIITMGSPNSTNDLDNATRWFFDG